MSFRPRPTRQPAVRIGTLFQALQVSNNEALGVPPKHKWGARVSQNKGVNKGEDFIDTPEHAFITPDVSDKDAPPIKRQCTGGGASAVACACAVTTEWACSVVCDGHGGQMTARYVASTLRQEVFEALKNGSDPVTAIEHACATCTAYIESKKFKDGSTMVMMLHQVDTDHAWIAWMGDSVALQFHGQCKEPLYISDTHDLYTQKKREWIRLSVVRRRHGRTNTRVWRPIL